MTPNSDLKYSQDDMDCMAKPAVWYDGAANIVAARTPHVPARPAYNCQRLRIAVVVLPATNITSYSSTITGAATITCFESIPSAHTAIALAYHTLLRVE